jgi:glycosyltransferase involved in cell wall biosynthesis
MRVIHITPSYKPAFIYGGPIASVSSLCESLNSHCETIVLTTLANGKGRLNIPSLVSRVDGVLVYFSKSIISGNLHFSPALLYRLYKEIKREKAIVHVHSWWNFTAIMSSLLALTMGVKVILSPRGMLTGYTFKHKNPNLKSILHESIGKHLIKRCHLHATSIIEVMDLQKVVDPSKITLIPNILLDLPKRTINSIGTWKDGIPSFKLLFLSRIDEKKGLENLFEALATIQFRWRLTIAGRGKPKYIESLKKKATDLGIDNHIDWIGFVNNGQKFLLIACHQLTLLFSYNENFGNIILESLHMGTPVAISDQVGLADFVKKYDLGWVNHINKDAIAKTIFTAYHDKKKRLVIRRTAGSIVDQVFSPDLLINRYLKLYGL